MRKDKELKKFVHASCAHVKQAVIDKVKDVAGGGASIKVGNTSGEDVVGQDAAAVGGAAPSPSPPPSSLPHGLAESSLRDYSKEWSYYIKFVSQRSDVIPGRDVDWDIELVWEYLQFRATTCKPETIKSVLTKLSHFGTRNKFVLATSRFDDDAFTYRILSKMKKQLAIDARNVAKEAGVPYEPIDRCTPLGQRTISMILSSFELTSKEKFAALSRKDRHHVANALMQHTGGMRYGGFPARNYTDASFTFGRDGTIRLVTDWSRYPGRGQFYIEFPANPRFDAMWYRIYAPNGDLIETYPAATLLGWHFELLRRDGERHVFNPVPGEMCSRDARQEWIRDVLYRALPICEREARLAVEDATPHSFRAGLAGDLFREGVSLQRIKSICRWFSKAARAYVERPCLSMCRLTNGFRLIERF